MVRVRVSMWARKRFMRDRVRRIGIMHRITLLHSYNVVFATCHLLPHASLGMMSHQHYTNQVILGCDTVNIIGFFDCFAPKMICLDVTLLERGRRVLEGYELSQSALADWVFALFL